ncbi:MAG: hypothetical protein ILO42_01470 [Clostridia bacterium]|nr:hypothetical protein [Clostridia bacterium]MBP5269609.1 hypothetical protein [Clostridia bacterium]
MKGKTVNFRFAVCLLLCACCLAFNGCAEGTGGRSGISGQGKTVGDVISEAVNGTATAKAQSPLKSPHDVAWNGKIDVDLTSMNSTMVYSQVYDMMTTPDDYLGKTVKMTGTFNFGKGDDRYYFACIIRDATACCAQGIEFVLKDPKRFPDEYPAVNQEITVVGIFDTYYEGEYRYCQLSDAVAGW